MPRKYTPVERSLGCLLSPFFRPVVSRFEKKRRHSIDSFLEAHDGTLFVICGSRGGWREFGENNIRPAVSDFAVFLFHEPNEWEFAGFADGPPAYMLREAGAWGRKPLIVFVKGGRLSFRSAHEVLLPLKQAGRRRSPEAQAGVRSTVRAAADAMKHAAAADAPCRLRRPAAAERQDVRPSKGT